MPKKNRWYVGAAVVASTALLVQPALAATKTTKKATKTTKRAVTTKATAAPSPTAAPVTTAAAPATTAATGDVDPNGVLRVVTNIANNTANTQFDPIRIASPALPTPHGLIYDYLLRWQPDGSFAPGLAKSAQIVGEKTITVELQPNLKFSDGTPLDAEAAKFNILRTVAGAPRNPTSLFQEMTQIDEVVVESPTKFTLRLKTPIAGYLYQLLARGEFFMASPTAINKGQDMQTKPVGAGPFLLDSLAPDQRMRFVKNPSYFEASKVRLTAVEFVHATDPTAMSNAILAGQADIADNISIVTARALRSNQNVTLVEDSNDGQNMFGMLCKRDGPLANQKVRQAMNFALDKEAVNRIVFEGKGEVMDGLVSKKDKILYDAKYKDYYKRDVDKAKRLLTEAGYPNGFSLDFYYTLGDSQVGSEILQQNLKDIGINLNLAVTNNSVADFFNGAPKRPGMFFVIPRVGLDKVTRTLTSSSTGNICAYNDEELNRVIEILRAKSLDDPETKRSWNLMTDIVFEKALHLFGTFGVTRNAHNKNVVGNATYVLSGTNIPFLWLASAYKKK